MSYEMKIPEEMRRKYLDRRKKDLEELESALRASDFSHFKRIGHQLKGNGATYGYKELGELGETMEKAGIEENRDNARACLDQLIQWLKKNDQ